MSIGPIIDMGYVVMFGKHTCWIVAATTPHKILVVGHRDLLNVNKLEIMMPPKHEQLALWFYNNQL